ncbi:hypothetical protein [Vitiosangium sp. GDMCC 1.1324]|uniref:hypothetical protein n=1 Tax=Vitiosangium sp. (strain GDMCC 1.1324) TaxID=2138576 RepID=UPI000D3BB76A|nr:hypothetical protein [Vitiosangium sp. GDMCC 1.1324]PTL83841.1 hypothetical protein DAT35_10260 [Vitiosangium sp. GDMCC 1.1324]
MFTQRIRSYLLASSSALLLLGCGGPLQEESPAASGQEPSTSQTAPLSASCYDECYQASSTCPQQCGASQAACDAATAVCYDSCNRGVGPWLPC